jgi:succinate dehydrogenase / fumarate reductase cytochrome b subunit
MGWLRTFLFSNIGMKLMMATSGLVLVGFVIVHMIGNMQIYLGPHVFNEYAALLQGTKELLWAVRITLLTSVIVHIVSAVVLTRRSRAARPTGYKTQKWMSGSYAVRTMRWGGVILLLFIVFHILHLTMGVVGPEAHHCEMEGRYLECQAYQNVIRGFRVGPVAAFYIVAQLCLGMHLAHGIWSMFRTFGVGNPRFDTIARRIAVAFSTLVTVGNISIPVTVYFGLIG